MTISKSNLAHTIALGQTGILGQTGVLGQTDVLGQPLLIIEGRNPSYVNRHVLELGRWWQGVIAFLP